MALGATLMTVVCLSAFVSSTLQKRGGTRLNVLPDEIYEYFRAQPNDTVIGGTANLLTDIMVRSLRSVVVIPHLSYPYDKYYYPLFKERIVDMFMTDCVLTRSALAQMRDKYRMRYFVVDTLTQGTFSGGWKYVDPFRSIISERLSGGKACKTEIDDEIADLIAMKSGSIAVLDLKSVR